MTDTKIEELIAEARKAVLVMDHERAYQGGLVGRLADALEQVTAERDALRAEAREAHDLLVWMAVELGWATDGRLKTAVGHAKEVLRVRTAERDAALSAIREARALVSDWQANGNSRALGDPSADVWHKAAHQLLVALDGQEADRG